MLQKATGVDAMGSHGRPTIASPPSFPAAQQTQPKILVYHHTYLLVPPFWYFS